MWYNKFHFCIFNVHLLYLLSVLLHLSRLIYLLLQHYDIISQILLLVMLYLSRFCYFATIVLLLEFYRQLFPLPQFCFFDWGRGMGLILEPQILDAPTRSLPLSYAPSALYSSTSILILTLT